MKINGTTVETTGVRPWENSPGKRSQGWRRTEADRTEIDQCLHCPLDDCDAHSYRCPQRVARCTGVVRIPGSIKTPPEGCQRPERGIAEGVPEDFTELVGWSWSNLDIAKYYGVSTGTVSRWKDLIGLPNVRPGTNARKVPADLPELVALQWTNVEIAKHYRVTNATVTRWRRWCGLPPARETRPRRPPPEDFARYVGYGCTIPQLQERYGVGKHIIRDWKEALGLLRGQEKGGE